ncbi:MAG: TonB-dependent receptor [Spongiibacteraceae bacterium]
MQCGAAAWAADEDKDLNYVLQLSLQELLKLDSSIASGESSSILKSVSTVSVITRDDIERYNFSTVADALKTVAGFDVYRTYYMNSIPTARGILQDHYSNKVLLMINNTPTWHAVTGEGNLDRINIHDIEKIEVLKGPASVLYGTNAYAGAINIVLKKPEAMKNNAYAQIGNDDHYGAGGSWGHTSEDGDLALMASAHTNHDSRQRVHFVDEKGIAGNYDDYTDTNNFTFTGRYQEHSLLINAYDNTESYMGIVPLYDSGIGYGQDISGYLLGYQFDHRLDDVSKLTTSIRYDWNRRNFLRTISDGAWGESEGYHIAGKAIYSRQLNSDYHFDIGFDIDQRECSIYRNYYKHPDQTITDNNMKDRSVLEYSFFSTLGYEQGNWKWDVGVRSVENELYSNSVSGRATVVYLLSEQSSVKFIAAQSYRSPSLFELYFIPPEQTIFGNPDLSPEKSTSYEVAYLRSHGKLFTQISVYDAYYTDKIFRDRGNVTLANGSTVYNTLIYQNGGDIHVVGVETETRYQADTWSTFVNLNWQDGDKGDREPGTDHYNFKYVPTYTVSAGLSKAIAQVMLSSVLNYRDSTEGSTPEDIDASLTLDVAATYQQHLSSGNELKHKILLQNITDERVEIADYARRNGLEAVPQLDGRWFTYEISLTF